jgi:hypothetical protein
MGSRDQGNKPKSQQHTTDKSKLKANPTDPRDQQIKAEPDTERIRSERQSVLDADKKKDRD